MTKVAINGLGRIGRATLKILMDSSKLELVAANDIASPENIVYLLGYDTVYGRFPKCVQAHRGSLRIDDREVRLLQEKDPEKLPWGEMGIDVVFESTGVFTKPEELEKHLKAGAGHVILSAPAKGADVPIIVHKVNDPEKGVKMISCASCTTNAITPVVEIMGRRIGVKKAMMTTIHAYTSSQQIVDGPAKNHRRGRAGAMNLVPTSTGAAKATTKALPKYEGKFNGVAVRVPVPAGSLADIVLVTERPTSVEEINRIFTEEANGDKYRDVLTVNGDEIVSADIIQNSSASIIDTTMTQVVDGDLVKVMAWYDNEWGYAAQMVREAIHLTQQNVAL